MSGSMSPKEDETDILVWYINVIFLRIYRVSHIKL